MVTSGSPGQPYKFPRNVRIRIAFSSDTLIRITQHANARIHPTSLARGCANSLCMHENSFIHIACAEMREYTRIRIT